ncbi:hypothetical protein [Streptomyces sp. NPDC007088]|uniref:hypothetical protein n=1 Tax=Streptomyces sp. NPDC007088 TaxID=3364773 RepID=UPI0036AA66BC
MSVLVGTYAVDTRTGRVGLVVTADESAVRLRPIGVGDVWDAAPATVRTATVLERVRACTAYANARSRGEVL